MYIKSVILFLMDDKNNVRKMYVNYLRINKLGSQSKWSKEELLAGLYHFYELFGYFPRAYDIDSFKYLPSSRSIQRSYGGLVKLRSELLPNEITNYAKGEYRSKIAKRSSTSGKIYEKKFYDYLVKEFKEISIHEHKIIRPGEVSCDFFVYLNDSCGVVIDVFYAESLKNLVNIVNIKLKRYKLVLPETYLIVVGNNKISQAEIDVKTENRHTTIPSHINICTENYFKSIIIPDLKIRSQFNS